MIDEEIQSVRADVSKNDVISQKIENIESTIDKLEKRLATGNISEGELEHTLSVLICDIETVSSEIDNVSNYQSFVSNLTEIADDEYTDSLDSVSETLPSHMIDGYNI